MMLAACGFSPIYKDNHQTSQFLESVEMSSNNSVEGADFYNHLKNILPQSNKPRYLLSTNYSFTKATSIIQKTSDVTRESMTIRINYTLKDKLTGKTIASESFSRFSSFNLTFSPYSNEVNQQDIRKNLAIMSAEEIRNRLIMLSKKKNL